MTNRYGYCLCPIAHMNLSCLLGMFYLTIEGIEGEFNLNVKSMVMFSSALIFYVLEHCTTVIITETINYYSGLGASACLLHQFFSLYFSQHWCCLERVVSWASFNFIRTFFYSISEAILGATHGSENLFFIIQSNCFW
jgi:hypothetical protein